MEKYIRNTKQTRILSWLVLKMMGIIVLYSVFNHNTTYANPPGNNDCDSNCFNTEIITTTTAENCITYTVQVNHDGSCAHALSHYNIAVPCGHITEASNSEGWPMEINAEDPTTGIYGLKVDEIKNFGEDNYNLDSFHVTYTVCYESEACASTLDTMTHRFGYKAGTCTYHEEEDNSTPLSVNTETISPTCGGSPNAAIYLEISGGEEPYSFLWNTGDTTQNLENIYAGEYEVTVYDALQDSISKTINIESPDPLQITNDSVTHTSCNQNNGSVELSVNGGTPPYTYTWSNNDTTQDIAHLAAGNYTVTITDNNQCSVSKTYTVHENNSLQATLSSSILECYEEGEGTINLSVSGGTPPYTYAWSNGDTTQNLTNAGSGRHSVTITDAAGCTLEKSHYISIRSIYFLADTEPPSCNSDSNGSIDLSAYYGTEPYTYTWPDGSHESSRSDLEAGWYYITLEDDSGCTASRNIYLDNPNPVTISHSISYTACGDSETEAVIEPVISGGTEPYSYEWSNGDTTETLYASEEGSYTITVTDANGCSNTHTVSVSFPESNLSLSATLTHITCQNEQGSIHLHVNGGNSPYDYNWSNGAQTQDIESLSAGTYSVTVEDANGCAIQDTFHIEDQRTEVVASVNDEYTNPECSSSDNHISASIEGADYINWQISGDWQITSETDTAITYSTGADTLITLSLYAENEQGCISEDSITLSCNTTNPEDTTDVSDPTDSTDEEEETCTNNCFHTRITHVEETAGSCYDISLEISHDGNCPYALSHYNVALPCGEVTEVSNSGNWPVEMNTTDPTTGVYGFKVDDIEGSFGQTSTDNTINVTYTFCPEDTSCLNEHLENLEVAYKAGQCVYHENAEEDAAIIAQNTNEQQETAINVYPNPFTENATFSFHVQENTYVKVEIFNMQGSKVLELFEGKAEAGTIYEFPLNSEKLNDEFYIYQLTTHETVERGKIYHQD